MSDTPRTDMFCRTVDHATFLGGKIYQATIETVDASFARQLERENIALRQQLERMKCCDNCDYSNGRGTCTIESLEEWRECFNGCYSKWRLRE
jgi:hypothetical protein